MPPGDIVQILCERFPAYAWYCIFKPEKCEVYINIPALMGHRLYWFIKLCPGEHVTREEVIEGGLTVLRALNLPEVPS